MQIAAPPEWIAADWGTSRLRVWAMGPGGVVLDRRGSDDGMGAVSPGGFESALLALVGDWLGERTPVIACGMVGARQGWVEAPYAPCPGPPLSTSLTRAPTTDPRLSVHIIPGMAQAAPADVMRGEETQVAGLLAREPDFAGALCLPGTHTKWVRVAQGAVTGFTSCMTGEVFSLLSTQSILRHSLGSAPVDHTAFAQALEEGGDPLPRLFGIRAADLLHGTDPDAARAHLSAMLIGSEVAALAARGDTVALLGDPALTALYTLALERVGCMVRGLDGETLTLAGLTAAHALLESTR